MGLFFSTLFVNRADLAVTSFNFAPWVVAMALLILIPAYYWVEGRKRIPWIKDHMIWKQYIFDRVFQQVPIFAFVGFIILGGQYLDTSFFSWHIWLTVWVLWGAAIAAYWLRFFIRDFPRYIVGYERQMERAKYLPAANRSKRRVVTTR